MPTPVVHLTAAEQILNSPTLPRSIRGWLIQEPAIRGAFFFGHIAPDVQVVSRQPRESTHFFSLPPRNHHPAYEEMLTAHPALAQPSALPPAQAAFLSGYMAHLLLDELWVREIFPIFGPEQRWADQRKRLLFHNVLRAWIDRGAQPHLHHDVGQFLRQAQPQGWLPFATDADLCGWRDLVADQFEPGIALRTVEIFANRAHIPDDEFLALLKPDAMQEQIFTRISPHTLEAFHNRALDRGRNLVARYLDGCAVRKFK